MAIAAALGLACLPGARAATSGQAPLRANVLLARARSEPALALDPSDPSRLTVVANPDFYGLLPHEPANGTFASTDGGATWLAGSAPIYGRFSGVADPSVAFDGVGNAYYLFMGETPTFCGESGNVALLLVRSSDGGRTWGPPTPVDINPADDKPFLAVGAVNGQTALYVTFTRWLDHTRQILFARSLDGGRTFSTPTPLDTTFGVDFGALPVAAPDNHLYVVWAHYRASNFFGPLQAAIQVRASADGGRTFSPARIISSFQGLPQMLVPGSIRVFPLPTAAVDARGVLYVAWVRARAMAQPRYAHEMEADVVLSRSRDGAVSFSAPVALNDTPRGDRFMPALSANGSGEVRVVFFDRRGDHSSFALYGVAAQDQGQSIAVWPNVRISAVVSTPYTLHYIVPGTTCVAPGRFMGDYIAAGTMTDGALATAWADTALGHPQETDLWFARVPAAYLHAGSPRTVR